MKRDRNKPTASEMIQVTFIVFLVAYGTSAPVSAIPVFNDETAVLCCTDSSYSDMIPNIPNEGDLSVSVTGALQNNQYAGDLVYTFINSRSLAYCLQLTDLPPPPQIA